jgi:mRNA-degrading endonuclease toxin of MazEF toxin-antitoxin module
MIPIHRALGRRLGSLPTPVMTKIRQALVFALDMRDLLDAQA